MKENNVVKAIKPNKFFGEIKNLLDTNAPTLATFGSILGVVATVYFMHRAAKNAADAERMHEERLMDIEEDASTGTLTVEEAKEEKGHEKLNHALRLIYIYRFALLSGIGSAGFAVLSNYLNGRTIAMMGTLLATNADKLQKLGEKAKEMVGEEKFQELKESVEKEMFAEKLQKGEVKAEKAKVIAKDGDKSEDGLIRYYIPFTDEFWDLPAGRLDDTIANASRMEYLSWNDFRNMNGFGSCKVGQQYCWDKDHPFKAHIGYANCVGQFGMKCLSFDTEPVFDKFGK